jgi:hypothetical protein
VKANQDWVYVLNLTSCKLNEDIYKGQYFLSKQFHVDIFIFYLLCVILSALCTTYKNDRFKGRPCSCLGDGQYSQESKIKQCHSVLGDIFLQCFVLVVEANRKIRCTFWDCINILHCNMYKYFIK